MSPTLQGLCELEPSQRWGHSQVLGSRLFSARELRQWGEEAGRLARQELADGGGGDDDQGRSSRQAAAAALTATSDLFNKLAVGVMTCS
jgi:hypothetical protein